jgi:hypothetical protein
MSREDQYNVTVEVEAFGSQPAKSLGTFDGFDGGEIDSEEAKFYPGGLAQAVSLGGRVNVGNVTVSRLYDLARDHANGGYLIAAVGKAKVIITKASLDVDGNAIGTPYVYKGTLKTFTPPNHDSQSSDPALFELEITSATVTKA